jgi:hypothetical protein
MRLVVFTFPVGLFLIAFAVSVPRSVVAEDMAKAHVAVVLFSNQTNSPSYDAACKAATETLSMTLNQLGRYRVQPMDSIDSKEDVLRAAAAEQNLDFIMYGSMSKGESGGITCSLSVFDRAKGKTNLSQSRKAAGVLDIFDATDDLVVAVLESMTGSHIGFGSLTLTNTGEKGSYTVLVDGSSAGANLASLDKVLIGQHKVTIVQKRMLGDREIAQTDVNIKEGETAELSFVVPYLMDDEKATVERLRSAIEAEWDDATAVGDVDAKTAELLLLFGDLSYSPKLSTYKDEATELAGEWVLRKAHLAIEGSAWEPKMDLLDAAGALYAGAKAYPDPGKIRKDFEAEAQLVETLFELQAGNALNDGDIGTGLECYGNALMVTTRYLGGKRMADCAYAMTMLQGLQEKAEAAQGGGVHDNDLKAVFGDAMRAGQRFYGLKDQIAAGKACVLVASDFATKVSVNGGDFADAPAVVAPAEATRTLSVQAQGQEPVAVAAAATAKLLFVQDGFAPFGKVGIGGGAPGAIEVSASLDRYLLENYSIMASLDGGNEVELPHLFENVAAGSHTLVISNVWAGADAYMGLQDHVTVEPGKRVVYTRTLEVGKGRLRVTDIPKGSTLTIDGDKRDLTDDSSGSAFFEGEIDAGDRNVEILNGNKAWHPTQGFAIVEINGSTTTSVKKMRLLTTLQHKSIKLKGKMEDWDGVETIFGPSKNPRPIKLGGSIIAGGTVCKDDKNIFVRIDFSNGAPDFNYPKCWRSLELFQTNTIKHHVNLQCGIWPDLNFHGMARSGIWVEERKNYADCGNYVVGASFIEMQFRLSDIMSYFDFSKPIQADVGFYTGTPNSWNGSPRTDILIGN